MSHVERMRKLTPGMFYRAAQVGNLAIDAVLADIRDLVADYDRLSAAPALPHQSREQIIAGWQPIETAPKDGTEVLLWLGSPWSKIEKARWYQPWLNWQIGSLPADPAREEEHYGIGSSLPTHWMPLPTPPARDLKGE